MIEQLINYVLTSIFLKYIVHLKLYIEIIHILRNIIFGGKFT